jgi:hypothetical protein
MNLFAKFHELIAAILGRIAAQGRLPADLDLQRFAVEPPRDPAHGDLSASRTPDSAELKETVLGKAGISTQQASEWERLAAVPQDEFEDGYCLCLAPKLRAPLPA